MYPTIADAKGKQGAHARYAAPIVSVHAVVPFKRPGTGKSRFGPAVSRTVRAELASAMLADVVAALQQTSSIARITITARGGLGSAAALVEDVDVVVDAAHTPGLNASVTQLAQRFAADDAMMVVMADLPGLSAADIEALATTESAVAIAPTHDRGTGGLVRRPHGCIATSFGPKSADVHAQSATSQGLPTTLCSLPGFAHDVDTLDDLTALPVGRLGAHTLARCRELGLALTSSPDRTCACFAGASVHAATSR